MALTVYKKGQGTAARGLAGVVAVLLGTWAAYQMYATLQGSHDVVRVVGTAIVAGVFVGAPVYLILFQRQVVDILIETQQEMRKVAWSSRAEVIGSTIVVLVTVVILAVYIFVTDQVVIGLFRLIRLYGD
jgi:preprotein translocase SecE subunit